MMVILAAILLTLSGCAGFTEQPPVPNALTTAMVTQPVVPRYKIAYQNRGLKVTPDFATVDRNGEFVLVPK